MSYRFLRDFGIGIGLALTATGLQLLLSPLLARDSYQLFLAAVALSAIRGGAANGGMALGVSAIAKTAFLFLPTSPAHGRVEVFAIRMSIFLLMGAVLCLVGGAVCVSLRRLHRDMDRAQLLRGLLPICSCCKRIRDEHEGWCELETYISRHSDAVFSHGYCPRCAAGILPEWQEAGRK